MSGSKMCWAKWVGMQSVPGSKMIWGAKCSSASKMVPNFWKTTKNVFIFGLTHILSALVIAYITDLFHITVGRKKGTF